MTTKTQYEGMHTELSTKQLFMGSTFPLNSWQNQALKAYQKINRIGTNSPQGE